MKKIISILVSFVFVCTLAGCGGAPSSNESSSTSATTQQDESFTTQQDESSATHQEESSDNLVESSEGEALSEAITEQQTEQEPEMENNILIVYFSATNTTEQIAQQAADILGADIYEIIPEDPYTEADLAYYTGGRADQEQDDSSARPSISGSVENIDQYDTILLGFRYGTDKLLVLSALSWKVMILAGRQSSHSVHLIPAAWVPVQTTYIVFARIR